MGEIAKEKKVLLRAPVSPIPLLLGLKNIMFNDAYKLLSYIKTSLYHKCNIAFAFNGLLVTYSQKLRVVFFLKFGGKKKILISKLEDCCRKRAVSMGTVAIDV